MLYPEVGPRPLANDTVKSTNAYLKRVVNAATCLKSVKLFYAQHSKSQPSITADEILWKTGF